MRKKQKPKSFCAASTALTGDAQTLAAKLGRHQKLVRHRVRHLHRPQPLERGKSPDAGQQRRSATKGPWSRSGTTVHLGVGRSGPRIHHGRDEAGRGTGAVLESHGRVEQAVDRRQVQGDQSTVESTRHINHCSAGSLSPRRCICVARERRHRKRCLAFRRRIQHGMRRRKG